MSTYTFINTQLNHLAGVAYFEEARDFVRVEARVRLDIARLKELHPKLYNTVEKDIIRGYRTTDKDIVERLERTLLKWCYASWNMSYIGKGLIRVHLSSHSKTAELKQAIQGLIELMENPCEVEWRTDHLQIKAPVDIVTREKKFREYKVPKIVHSFQQIRLLVIKELEGERELRQEALDVWRSCRILDLDWSK